MFDILMLGRWLPRQVQCVWDTSTFAPTPATEQQIEREWRKAASRTDVHLFDGALCRLEQAARDGENLCLRISRTSYRTFVGTNMARLREDAPPEASQLADPVGLSVALESADGLLLLGRRNDRVFYYPGYVHPFAGALEPAEDVDVCAEALRELKEELSLTADDVNSMSLVAIVRDAVLRQPELIFLARTPFDYAEIRRRLDPAEHREVVANSPKGLDAALADISTWTPVAVAAAIFFGRERLGPAWFGKTLERMGIARTVTAVGWTR
ncbi:MAG: NUDIX hydrolase [Tepidisphaeraceae bacterium]|jgi:8-oxo-dGTP pyrophosphatase MutT (NUDIX family)